MIRPIVKDPLFLSIPSKKASKEDLYIVQDLKDTLMVHRDHCVGMAANMIGYSKRIIIASTGFADLILINPEIVKKSESYETEEGCLSLKGTRKTIRYNRITVVYQDESFHPKRKEFTGALAQIIQHECDHCEGILI